MSSKQLRGKERSVVQSSTSEAHDAVAEEREPTWRSTCPECEGTLVTKDNESYCAECGLVISSEHIDHQPTRSVHGPSGGSGPKEWSVESINPFRVDKGLNTTFFLGSDGYGNSLSTAKKDYFGRLRRRHKRFRMDSDRDIRLNEGLRDVESIGGNLALPRYVAEDAALYLRWGAEARLPSGRMSWEALAAGAILLAARTAGFERSGQELAKYAKSSPERVYAGARKIRCKLGLTDECPPARDRAIEDVLTALCQDGVEGDIWELTQIARYLLGMADEEPIGPGTPRLTVAAAAVYAADRLTDGKHLTQPQVVEAVNPIVDMSVSKLGRYSRELVDHYEAHHENDEFKLTVATGPGFQATSD